MEVGPHLLGRIPSPFDARDFRLEDYLGADASAPSNAQILTMLDTAVADLKLTTVGYAHHGTAWQNNTKTQWWQGLNQIAQARAAIAGTPTPPSGTDKKWADNDPVLDQGQQGTCVGHGWAQWGNTLPVDDHFTHNDALDIYYAATVHDGQPDDPRKPGGGQQGASVRGGAQAVQDKGRLKAYAFTSTVATIRAWLQSNGPVVFGTDWTEDMFNPDGNGFIAPTGSVAGGHCYCCLGDIVSQDAAFFVNSWGTGWAKAGYFCMKWSDVAKLMSGNGEACTAVELS